jgi:hypothetical protein
MENRLESGIGRSAFGCRGGLRLGNRRDQDEEKKTANHDGKKTAKLGRTLHAHGVGSSVIINAA